MARKVVRKVKSKSKVRKVRSKSKVRKVKSKPVRKVKSKSARKVKSKSAKKSKSKKQIVVKTNSNADIVGYCMKCKAKRLIVNGKVVKFGPKLDRLAYTGNCKVSGTKMYKILSAENKTALKLD